MKRLTLEEDGFMTDLEMKDQTRKLFLMAFHADGSGGPQFLRDRIKQIKQPSCYYFLFPLGEPPCLNPDQYPYYHPQRASISSDLSDFSRD